MCSVFLPEEDRVVNIAGEHLEPVVPKQHEKVFLCLFLCTCCVHFYVENVLYIQHCKIF